MGADSMAQFPGSIEEPLPRWHKATPAIGVSIWILGLAGFAVLAATDPVQATAALLAAATFYYAGQFGAIPLGLAAGGDPLIVGLYVWAADAAGLLVFFPLTQFGVDRLAHRPGRLARWIRGMQGRARGRRAFIERFGAMGLFAFTALPFLFNSPIVGATLGRIALLPPKRTLAALLSAITTMSIVWTFAFARGLEGAKALDERLPWVIGIGSVTITVLIAGLLALLRWARRRRVPAAEL